MASLMVLGMFIGAASATFEEPGSLMMQPQHYKKNLYPKMVVFGDSSSDAGRRFNAPASFDFDAIGPFPWEMLFEDPDCHAKFDAYLPAPGSPTNGKVWASWLRVPEALNFATSSGTASDAFRSRERCRGYTGEGEDLPTGTLGEQITRYFHDILYFTDLTLDHTHIIATGFNDIAGLLEAVSRYQLGGAGYVDPVAPENVFKIVDGAPRLTFEPVIREILGAWQDGIARLVEHGVTGKILLANLPSPKGLPDLESGLTAILDEVSRRVNAAAEEMAQANPQVHVVDLYALTAALVDEPEVFTDLGFTAGTGSSLIEPCLSFDFFIDFAAEIMGTQAGRAKGCREECALCADGVSPCENCYQGFPSATMCENPETRVFWDIRHFTTAFHRILAEAVRQCSKDYPNYDHPWVELLCPGGAMSDGSDPAMR